MIVTTVVAQFQIAGNTMSRKYYSRVQMDEKVIRKCCKCVGGTSFDKNECILGHKEMIAFFR